jgi:hypothetical protein
VTNRLIPNPISNAHANRVEDIEHIDEGQGNFSDPVETAGLPCGDAVEPTCAAWTTGIHAPFAATLANEFACVVEQLCRHRSATNPRAVGLVDTNDPLHLRRRHACSLAGSSGRWRRGRDVWIGTVVDVQHGALGAFDNDAFAVGKRILDDYLSWDNHRPNEFGQFQQFLIEWLEFNDLVAKYANQLLIL